MDTFFNIFKKGLVGTIFVMFAFVATYVPQQWNQVEQAHAGGAGNISTETTQIRNNVELGLDVAANTISSVKNTIVAWATTALHSKEWVLDGIAWAVAKQLVSSMVQSLVNWINSGFQGSPMFVQDLQGFLRNAADQAVGEYISELGSVGSFICSPFRLDVQVSVALQYQLDRENQPAPTCTLTGIIDNLEGFLSGTQGSFSQGGWNDWFDITSSPQMYTPYGAALSAQTGARAIISNTKNEELAYLDFGSGFLSGKICETVHGAGTTKENCFVSKPGKIIQEALTFNLDSGRQSLIAADEFNEIINALIGQLANTALSGAAGLLGLSGGTGHTYAGFSGGSYLNAMSQDPAQSQLPNSTNILSLTKQSLSFERTVRGTVSDYENRLSALASDTNTPADKVIQAEDALFDTNSVIVVAQDNIDELTRLVAILESPSVTQSEVENVVTEYNKISLHQESDLSIAIAAWEEILQTN